ncbi:MAG: calcium/sodium antiporter [Candidatus Margulisbacteria bacterium]|nr:calcium/sodium antiporter [Candidatus Margulisiibacteriota bacterium]
MITAILFIIGFFLLIKGADVLVDGSAAIAKKFNISNIVIGLTIVAFGTSAPELIVNIFASVQGNSEIAIGNILGSNIANILLILGISAIIYPLTAKKNTVLKEIPFNLLAIIILGVMTNDIIIDGGIFSGLSRIDGIVLLGFFIIFLAYTVGITKSEDDIVDVNKIDELSFHRSILYVLLGLVGLVVGGKWIVDGAVNIAEFFNVSQSLIGLTVVAIGTSLPELATSAVAAFKKQSDIAIGNVVGSNIFNIFFVLGISSTIRPLPFNNNSNGDILMTIIASIILLLVVLDKKRVIYRYEGILMVLTYFAYVVVLVLTK